MPNEKVVNIKIFHSKKNATLLLIFRSNN